MTTITMPDDLVLRRVLWAYFNVWQDAAGDEKQVCYRWVRTQFEGRFGGTFHHSKLERLAELGLLTKGWLTRGGGSRHYTLNDPDRVRSFLAEVEQSLGGSTVE